MYLNDILKKENSKLKCKNFIKKNIDMWRKYYGKSRRIARRRTD